jgi:hypothetical protein|tara:strand:- start:371 stop:589 length:219 start_codon:yes stop_codon:yes gene_type:complete
MRLILDPRRKDDTVLGYAWIEPISYGYDRDGILASMLCKALLADDTERCTVSLIEIIEPELSEDLMMNYEVS